ncbi:hypothetical protein ZIOFF_071982 [Zingiber officinale]|uniref:EF-hand domain-containing protein n=1 Tax=Zingiber officinale TaxID=94328 RepID=A0A8J5CAE7_ZINOF|nr:hypothetical protein ZIOFF_071982 [Zingiber officinale]
MRNTSTMHTQYDVKEVQDHCNCLCTVSDLCSCSVRVVVFLLSVSQQEIVALYNHFYQLSRTAKGFISFNEFFSIPSTPSIPLLKTA